MTFFRLIARQGDIFCVVLRVSNDGNFELFVVSSLSLGLTNLFARSGLVSLPFLQAFNRKFVIMQLTTVCSESSSVFALVLLASKFDWAIVSRDYACLRCQP